MKLSSLDHPFNKKASWLYLVALLFYATNHMLIIALPFFSEQLGASQSDIGMIMGAYMFVSMFLRPVAGAIVDKLGSRNLFMITLVLNAIVLALYSIETLWAFAVMRALQGAILAFFSMTIHLLIIDLVSDKARGQGISMLSLASMLPYTFVPALVLYMKDHISMTQVLLLFTAIGACNILFGTGLFRSLRYDAKRQVVTNIKPSEATSIRTANRAIIFPAVIMLLASVVFCVAPTFLPLYLESIGLHTAPLYFLTETAVLILIRFYGRKYIPNSSVLPTWLIIPLIACFMLAPMLLFVSLSTPVLLVSALCNGIALSLLYPTLMTYITFVVPEQSRGYSIGWFIAAADLGTSCGAYLMGWLADEYSYKAMLATAACIGGAALLFTAAFKRKGRGRYVSANS
ncbi:staphylopine family metallophore export MFS transporter CntE [Paenibacillus glycanilyticus]|uniref:MFS transporter n=1 Tax=Paenibacillus glycanilyticus TaxID=126569 RepID=A0ABQ6GC94_9BACL|nr:MFS transporter [Paenibacillus glycanilyticus]GLX66926.1 MFS transporter [Paenibacillus glycanilyticus]